MKAKMHEFEYNGKTCKRLMFMCPGCNEEHMVPIKGEAIQFDWNGSLYDPTFNPSVLVTSYRIEDGKRVETRCHSFIRDGYIEFLTDCTHALAGQTVELLEADGITI